jgi:hypothetical protein
VAKRVLPGEQLWAGASRALGWGQKEVSVRWLKASKALKKEDQIYGLKLAEMVKKHTSEAFCAFDAPLEAAIFSALVEIMKEIDE